eukprot:CAMPEP_0204213318 /NCGR_PEP_ID=MMETSP0361-20130328/75898_1 /ASSEMBLY_ACC=CAM_ASM_000343 /TAXON_ID=268821 /ORGANISM="Scrippsiella Hangoei, Strain SHTV-5" /LENGTH=44 /DNA_ID= /DNA_START= /DNA_END= /DNA_ORIENTATION=
MIFPLAYAWTKFHWTSKCGLAKGRPSSTVPRTAHGSPSPSQTRS